MGLMIISLFFFLMAPCSVASSVVRGNHTDQLALLAFRDKITQDPHGLVSSWNGTVPMCQWPGVECSSKHPGRVTVLNLSSKGLAGPISASIGNLTFLRALLLLDNNFYGEIPPEIGRLHRLRNLNLSFNSLDGVIPINLTNCKELRMLGLMSNQLTGRIPFQLGSLSKLEQLFLSNSSLSGPIPSSLGNLSSLTLLSLRLNYLDGRIPTELGNLANLQHFQVYSNMLSGIIPSSLFNLSSLRYISVAQNKLHGSLPPDMGNTLPNLEVLYLGGNHFTGAIPPSLPNASRLEDISIPWCKLSGQVPPDLGRLAALTRLLLGVNQLEARDANGWRFFDSLANCSRLEWLDLDSNMLEGSLPNSIANLSTQLQMLLLGSNPIYGTIPSGIGKLVNLNIFDIEDGGLLGGTIPEAIGELKNLQALGLQGNKLRGHIPSSIGNLSKLIDLFLGQNHLEGPIPPSLGGLQQLSRVDLAYNNLNGSIPKDIFRLPYLSVSMDLSYNSLSGPLPLEVGNLGNARGFGAAGNKLSGEIPLTLGNCEVLEILDLKGNLFQGTIPSTLGNVKGLRGLDLSYNILSGSIPSTLGDIQGLQQLDLSHNNLSGAIPEFLASIPLLLLNLSFNHLQGEVPLKGVFTNVTALSLIGNDVCGGIPELRLPACPPASSSKARRHGLMLKLVIPLAGIIVLSLILFAFFVVRHLKQRDSRKKEATSKLASANGFPKVSYGELARATDGFSSANLIGKGTYGSVYKGSLDDGITYVALKIFNLGQRGASKSFIAECEALRNIRHRNLIKIQTSCSSVDPKGNDFKALVFEFMPNGSLERWLHPDEDEQHYRRLSLIQRLNIANDVANALEYLHYNCQPPMVHCDLKPSNVLLHNDMSARVGDFGLAKFISMRTSFQDSSSSTGIRGSIGYIAPEYGMGGSVCTSGDVYSYGILVLEMFTGKRPVDDIFKGGLNLQKFVEMGVSTNRVIDIIDPRIFLEDENTIDSNECLVSVLGVGLSCSNPLLNERMNMREVATKMKTIREAYQGVA